MSLSDVSRSEWALETTNGVVVAILSGNCARKTRIRPYVEILTRVKDPQVVKSVTRHYVVPHSMGVA